MSRFVDAHLLAQAYLDVAREEHTTGLIFISPEDVANTILRVSEEMENVLPVKHAHWKWDKDGMDWGIGAWVCSNCGLTFPDMEVALNKNAHIRKYAYSHYCGCCGAKMDEEDS